ncbi:putative helicase [Tetraselmis virus 1]|uniref:Putative helicase n=1 Tax=Tetraselmis virus 1 TaxID=2060617 RepID=A0A2P0VNT0_9VIRU|nr:putative helicase [Tetraselmis virus 1]AUF82557.1 putative helicase [Tetraselmis virus 1]
MTHKMAPKSAKEKYIPIPYLGKKNFPTDIQNKREFKVFPGNEGCESNKSFRLQPVQQFVGMYMSPFMPYQSILLRHGTGVGKTCAAIQAAEMNSSKKTLVILPSSVQGGFESNVFDTKKSKNTETVFDSSKFQCTGNTYYTKDFEGLSQAALKKNARSRIRKRYDFYGHDMFGNLIDSIYARIEKDYTGESVEIEKKSLLNKLFNDRLIIVDEAHTLRSSGNETKRSYTALFEVLKACNNTKLILLTATPMFNSAIEIVDMVNLMLINENKALLKHSEIFKNDKLTSVGEEKLKNALFGRVSDISYEDDTFPAYVSFSMAGLKSDPWTIPTKQRNGKSIPEQDRLTKNEFELLCTKLSKEQLKAYNTRTETVVGSMSENQQIENVCYNASWKDTNEDAFMRAFKKIGKLRFSYRDKRYLSANNILNHAPKMKKIIDSIKSSAGTCFVYSYYKWSGVYPLAIALEEEGFVPFTGSTMLQDAPKSGSLTAPRYIIITKEDDTEDGMSVTEKVNALNDPSNKIKVILGTDTASQGLDFKRIREVHILEPWWNMSKMDQVIGRGIRRCSHASLPPEERNTTVCYHCSVTGDDRETQDQHGYRSAINKKKEISKVEKAIAESAVDCGLYEFKKSEKEQMISSQGKRITVTREEGKPAKCRIKWSKVQEEQSTIHPSSFKIMIDLMAWEVKDVLLANNAMTYKELKDYFGVKSDDILLSLTLDTLINPILSWKWLKNDLIVYRNGLYILIPSDMEHKSFTLLEAKLGYMFGEDGNKSKLK